MKLVILSVLIMGICLFNKASAQSASEIATSNAIQAFGNKLTLLFAALTGKHNVFAQYSQTALITANLRSLQSGTDSLFDSLLAQPCLSDANVELVTTSTALAQDALSRADSLTQYSSPSDVQSAREGITTKLGTISNIEVEVVSSNGNSGPCSPPAASSTTKAYTEEQSDFDVAINGVITLYNQICIPSPLYPTVQPVCVVL